MANAAFIRFIEPDESLETLVREAKALTYEFYCEHAVLEPVDGRVVLVRGGPFRIELEQAGANDPLGRRAGTIYVEVPGEEAAVSRLRFHTHPKPTGPSDDDMRILRILGQESSLLFEIFGPQEGTEFRPKPGMM